MRSSIERAGGLLAATLVLVSGTACGASNAAPPERTTLSVTVDDALAAKVPEAARADGKLVVGIDPTYPPAEFMAEDDKTIIGFDVELFDAVAGKLGLTTEYVKAPFDGIVAGVNKGTYEIGVSSLTVNLARKKTALMVGYFLAGTTWVTKQGNPAGIDPKKGCGAKVAVQETTVQQNDIVEMSALCAVAKQPEISIEVHREQRQVTAALMEGRVDAMLAYSPVGAYAVTQSNGSLQLLGGMTDVTAFGYAVPLKDMAFAEAVRDAVAALIVDGTYLRLLEKWGVAGGAVEKPVINP